MALLAVAEENKKLSHKRLELQPMQCDGGGECVAWCNRQRRGRGHWSLKSGSKELTPKSPRQRQMREHPEISMLLADRVWGLISASGTV